MLLWPMIKKRLQNAAVVAHGHGTEKRFLQAFPAHGFGPWIDTLPLARACFPDLGDYSLGNVCDSLGLTNSVSKLVPGKTWHDALFDAAASIILLQHIISHYQLAKKPVSFLIRPDTTLWQNNRGSRVSL